MPNGRRLVQQAVMSACYLTDVHVLSCDQRLTRSGTSNGDGLVLFGSGGLREYTASFPP